MNEIPEWFIGSKLNYAQNILKFRDDRIAIISAGEDASKSVQYTFKQLFTYVEKIAAGLKKANVGVGDVIVAYVPNCPEAVYEMFLIKGDDNVGGCINWGYLVFCISRFWHSCTLNF